MGFESEFIELEVTDFLLWWRFVNFIQLHLIYACLQCLQHWCSHVEHGAVPPSGWDRSWDLLKTVVKFGIGRMIATKVIN